MSNSLVPPCVTVLLAFGLSADARGASSGPAIAQIAGQFDKHPLIMIGELHRWAELHAFLRDLIRDPRFICRADDVVVEFGNSRLQDVADAYASGRNVTETQLQSTWRETAVPLTWNSPVYRQFFDTVRDINKRRLCTHPLRIVLGDPPLDWSKIKSAKDYEPFTDRDGHFAEVVEREVLSKHHRAFLLAGQWHALKQSPENAEGSPDEPRTAQLIERKHPGLLFCIAPVPSPAAAEAIHMGAPPSFKVVRGTELEHANFGLIDPGRVTRNGRAWAKLSTAFFTSASRLSCIRRRPSISSRLISRSFDAAFRSSRTIAGRISCRYWTISSEKPAKAKRP